MTGDWRSKAACAGCSKSCFSGAGQSTKSGKKVCACCAVAGSCLAYATSTGMQYRIWGADVCATDAPVPTDARR